MATVEAAEADGALMADEISVFIVDDHRIYRLGQQGRRQRPGAGRDCRDGPDHHLNEDCHRQRKAMTMTPRSDRALMTLTLVVLLAVVLGSPAGGVTANATREAAAVRSVAPVTRRDPAGAWQPRALAMAPQMETRPDMSGPAAGRGETALPAGLRAAVEQSRYRIRPPQQGAEAGTYRAANRAQGLDARFNAAGVSVGPAASSGPPWQWGLQLERSGYGERLEPIASAHLVVEANRIEYRRGALTEWYVNDARGLEQGFTVAAPPRGRDAHEPLVLELGVSGGLRAEVSEDGQQMWFARGAERVLAYSHLAVADAAGVRLPARMRLAGRSVRLEVDDRGAAYPVVIDPLIVSETHLVASDGAADDWFGTSVAISGDTAVVGAPFDDTAGSDVGGSVYVYVRSGTTWSEQQHLVASDGALGDFFGSSVAISGDTAVVGASYDDTAGGESAGSVYVYVRSGTTWSEQAHLVASDGAGEDTFGASVAISGDTAVVGAPFDDTDRGPNGGPNAGSVYVYVRSGTTWSKQAHLVVSDGAVSDFFGSSVAISGDTAVVGAPQDNTTGGTNAGSVYVYVRSGTSWSEQQHLVASDGAADDAFGFSVAISGETLVVGAPADDTAGAANAGSAYVYVRSGTTWSEQAHLMASDGAVSDNFGWSVAISGESLVIGAPFDDTAAGVDAGSVYVYVRSGTTWSEQAHVVASDGAQDDRFGTSVAISGETLVVGAYLDDTAGGENAGSAYVYTVVPGTDLALTQQNSPDPATTGQALSYTLTLTNHGPGPATNLVVTDTLPAATSFVSCAATQGGVCEGTDNSRRITFASLAANTSATITLSATVTCGVSEGTVLSNTASVTAVTADPNPANNSATAQTTAANPPPVVTATVATASLWPPNHTLIPVGLGARATDTCPAPSRFRVLVFGNEDDETATRAGDVDSPDATALGLGTLRVRAERVESGNGRVYLLVVVTTDAGGREGLDVQTVVVPRSQTPADITAVRTQAAAARKYALAHNGNPPPGYVPIGDGPVIGTRQ